MSEPFTRQFLIAPHRVEKLTSWTVTQISDLWIHAHHALELTTTTTPEHSAVLLGFAIDPRRPEATNADVLSGLVEAHRAGLLLDELDWMSGRFALILSDGREVQIYSDACALRSVVFTWDEAGSFYAASDTSLLGTATPLDDRGRGAEYTRSSQFYSDEEHWIPAGATLYPGVGQLVANHRLDVRARRMERFWPREALRPAEFDDARRLCSTILQEGLRGAHRRFRLALGLTGGMDSRLLLASARTLGNDLYTYTLLYRSLTHRSSDVAIPVRLAHRLGLTHKIIDASTSPPAEWSSTFHRHSTMAHFRDVGPIVYANSRHLPPRTVVVNGTVAEVGRDSRFYAAGRGMDSVQDVLARVRGWADLPFAVAAIEAWHASTIPLLARYGYEPTAIFYWEHRAGSWQAQSQLESDLVSDSFTPFSNRMLLTAMLGVPLERRIRPRREFMTELIGTAWPETLTEPINPETLLDRVQTFFFRARRKLARAIIYRQRRRDLLGSMEDARFDADLG